jgi:hypothetical protein
MRTIELIYGQTGQVVEHYPPEMLEGVPSSASAIVFRGSQDADDTGNAEFAPAVSIDAVATTVDAASGQSQPLRRRLYLTATTGIAVGRQYRLANAAGQREVVVPVAVVTDDYLTLQDDLKYDYTTADALTGSRLSWTVDATWVADESNLLHPELPPYRVIWTYTIASLVRRDYSYLRLVRQVSTHHVTLRTIQGYWPDVSLDEQLNRRGQGFDYMISAAWDRVRIDIITSGYKPDQFRDTEIIDQLVTLKALQVMAMMGMFPSGRDPEAWAAETKLDYDNLLGRSILNLKAQIDQSTSGAIAQRPAEGLWFRR